MKLAIDKNEISKNGRALKPEDTEAHTKAALLETLGSGKVGSLTVDPQYLVLRSQRKFFLAVALPVLKYVINFTKFHTNTLIDFENFDRIELGGQRGRGRVGRGPGPATAGRDEALHRGRVPYRPAGARSTPGQLHHLQGFEEAHHQGESGARNVRFIAFKKINREKKN